MVIHSIFVRIKVRSVARHLPQMARCASGHLARQWPQSGTLIKRKVSCLHIASLPTWHTRQPKANTRVIVNENSDLLSGLPLCTSAIRRNEPQHTVCQCCPPCTEQCFSVNWRGINSELTDQNQSCQHIVVSSLAIVHCLDGSLYH